MVADRKQASLLPKIKIYGERNTGTNYLSELIRRNLIVKELRGVAPNLVQSWQKRIGMGELIKDAYFAMSFRENLGWKHMKIKAPAELQRYAIAQGPVVFVTLTKNPYSWLLSMYKRPYHRAPGQKPDFESFIADPWHTVQRDNAGRTLSSPVELWNQKNESYIPLHDRFSCVSVRYEELLVDPAKVIDAVESASGAIRKVEKFEDHVQSTKESGKGSGFYRDYYLNELWKEKLSSAAIQLINERLNRRVMEYFGYELL